MKGSQKLQSATVYLLLKDGASVIMAARDEERLKKIKTELAMFGQLDYVMGDASNKDGAACFTSSQRYTF